VGWAEYGDSIGVTGGAYAAPALRQLRGPDLEDARAPFIPGQYYRRITSARVAAMADQSERDVEKVYSNADFVAKLRRLADAIEHAERFEIQIAGKRIYVPVRAEFSVEHEASQSEEEIEFQIKWKRES
jgi:amphi-Trp domain-containing protein